MKQNPELQTETTLNPLNEEIIRTLVENHKHFLSFLTRRVGNETLAEDILQQSVSKAIKSPPESQEETSILPWFYRILKNALIDTYRTQDAEKRKKESFAQHLYNQGEDKVDFDDELKESVCQCIHALLPTLHQAYAILIERIDLNNEPISQVAQDLNISENNLYVKLHRARAALKTSLERTCGTCTKHGCLNCSCAYHR